jgi:hypothetical protein
MIIDRRRILYCRPRAPNRIVKYLSTPGNADQDSGLIQFGIAMAGANESGRAPIEGRSRFRFACIYA